MWAVRNALWNRLTVFKFRSYKPVKVPTPSNQPLIELVPMAGRYSGVPITEIVIAAKIPADEAEKSRYLFYRFQAWLARVFSPMGHEVPEVPADAKDALDRAYPASYRKCFPIPMLPDELRDDVDLGALAACGPYTSLLTQASEGGFQWDLGYLDAYESHQGLRPLGARVRFEIAGASLRAVEIDCDLGICRPDEPQWRQAKRLALCAASTDTSIVQHFAWIHYTANAHMATATRNALPPDHPLRRLLWPHMFRSNFTTDIITEGQLVKGADFENIFSYTHPGLCHLFEDAAQRYDLSTIDPERTAARRGLGDIGFELPPMTNRMVHFAVMHDHARRYLELYYPTDAALASDERVGAWISELDRLVPGGTKGVVGDEPTVAGLARLVGSFIHLVTVEHEMVGVGLWNYQLWTTAAPVRVYANDRRERADVYQRLVNFNFLLNVPRTPLVQDFSYLALDEPAAAEFRRFLSELQQLQHVLDAEPPAPWKVSPKVLEANINI